MRNQNVSVRSPFVLNTFISIAVAICTVVLWAGVSACAAEPSSANNRLHELRTVTPQPDRPFAELLTSASWMKPSELRFVVRSLGGKSYHVAGFDTHATVDAPDGAMVYLGNDFGVRTTRGEVVRQGLLWNISRDSVQLRVGDAEDIVVIAPGDIFGIGWLYDKKGNAILAASCETTCDGVNAHACCRYNGAGENLPTCLCVATKLIDGAGCDAGGRGSTECRLEQLTPF